MNCPCCGKSDQVHITTLDYGFGYGTEYACFRNTCSRSGELRFISKTAEAKRESDASRALSASNAAAYRREHGDKT